MRTRSISAVLVRPLVRALEGVPGALGAFWRATDLTPQMVADSETRVSPSQLCVAWAQAIQLAGDPALALAMAEATPPGAFGVVEYVCRSAATLGDALRQWVRYLGLLDDAVEVALVPVGDATSLRVIRESEAPAPASHELCFALVVRNARLLLGDRFSATAVRFTHPEPATRRDGAWALGHYRAFFGCHVAFGSEHTELVVPASVLDTPLPTADPNLLAILVQTADGAADKRAASAADLPLTGQVRRALRAALGNDDAQLEGVARRLGMTERSLQRRLKDEGTSFQALRDGMRQELADRYLEQGMSVAEISFLLGFSEPSAFFRAFKRWTGQTPIERRAAVGVG